MDLKKLCFFGHKNLSIFVFGEHKSNVQLFMFSIISKPIIKNTKLYKPVLAYHNSRYKMIADVTKK